MLRRRLVPPPAAAVSTLYAFYDLSVAPITFDFLWFLAGADLARRERGLAQIHVVIVPGPHHGLRAEDEDYEMIVDASARGWRVNNILVPACGFLPTVAGVTIAGSRAHAAYVRSAMARHVYPAGFELSAPTYHHPSESLYAAKEHGSEVAVLRAPEAARRAANQWLSTHAGERRAIVITLRNYDYMPARNSNLAAWVEFAKGLDRRIYVPIIVPDVDQTLAGLPAEVGEFSVCAEATWNLGLRLALYEGAYLNLGVNGGPMGLCQLSRFTRYVTFKIVMPGVPQTSEAFLRSLGFTVGESFPFASPYQKLLWHESDDLEVIRREFAAMVARIDSVADAAVEQRNSVSVG
jgi:hypothetical protein